MGILVTHLVNISWSYQNNVRSKTVNLSILYRSYIYWPCNKKGTMIIERKSSRWTILHLKLITFNALRHTHHSRRHPRTWKSLFELTEGQEKMNKELNLATRDDVDAPRLKHSKLENLLR